MEKTGPLPCTTLDRDLKRTIVSSSISRIKASWLGLTDYADGIKIQKDCLESISREGPDQLLGLEHPRVITLGLRGHETDDLAGDLASSFPIIRVRRGGQAVLHNPGQLVVYPIVNLRRLKINVREWIQLLESISIEVLSSHGIVSRRPPGCEPGLFVEDRKIGMIGVQISSGISWHGLALNIHNDLNDFKAIRLCGSGLGQSKVTSLRHESRSQASCQLIFAQWNQIFTERVGSLC